MLNQMVWGTRGEVLLLNQTVWDGLMEKVIKHEGTTTAERKEFLFIVPLRANQSFSRFIFICTKDAHTWSRGKNYMCS